MQSKNRQLALSRDMEQELKSRYAVSSQNGIGQDDTETESEDDELDEQIGYDGLGDNIELNNMINVDDNNPIDLVGITNQTAV